MDPVARHCHEIDRCNQRGGRMLSIVDLLDARTITRDAAAYALAAISRGASFMVGALPGGAGKTTVMGALLNFLPADADLAPADSMAAVDRGLASPRPRRCYICHEISSGRYYAYLWGETLRAYLSLVDVGHMLATNLHADTWEQARHQICRDNQLPEALFRRMNLIFFLSISRNGGAVQRRITEIWESDGRADHRPVFVDGRREQPATASHLVTPDACAAAGDAIDRLLASGVRTIGEVRRAILDGDALTR